LKTRDKILVLKQKFQEKTFLFLKFFTNKKMDTPPPSPFLKTELKMLHKKNDGKDLFFFYSFDY